MDQGDSNQSEQQARKTFLAYIVLAYATQGIAQHFCLVAQPLEFYLLKTLSCNASQVAAMLSVLMIPWMIKPIFGLLSDGIPLLGYRRKSYLTLCYSLAALAYLGAAIAHSLSLLIFAFLLTAVGMAAGTVILCGLTLEVGRPQAETRKFQAIQAVGYYCANIGSVLVGGYLCGHLRPDVALSIAATIASVPCLITAISSWFLVQENKFEAPPVSLAMLKAKLPKDKLKSLACVSLFMCCWSFSPGFGTPLYFHQTKDLGFSQIFIGQLSALFSLGMIAGAFIFRHFLDKKLSSQNQAKVVVIVGTCSTLAYLALGTPLSAMLLEPLRGLAEMLAILLVYGLAADVSPRDLESTSIAFLIAAYNIAEQISINIGAWLYNYAFKDGFSQLILVSAVATLACWLLIGLLPQEDQFIDSVQT